MIMKSKFKFSNPKLTRLIFKVNNDYAENEDSVSEIGTSISYEINKTSENEAVVELNIEIGELSDQSPFFVNLLIGAKFKLDDAIEGTTFDKLLEVNAPALLLSYARPIISSVSNQAGMKPINIPFINFTSQKKEDTN